MAASRGGLVAFGVGGVLVALWLSFAVVKAIRAWTSGPAAVTSTAAASAPGGLPGAPPQAAVAVREGMEAPGTEALRQLGCSPAIVMDTMRLVRSRPLELDEPRYVVTCDVPAGDPPTCETASAAYFTAAAGTVEGNVNLRVARRGAPPVCSRLYASTGADLGQYPRAK
jgi:hypothetical protein